MPLEINFWGIQNNKKNLKYQWIKYERSLTILNKSYTTLLNYMWYTVGENIIAATKIRNNYGAIQSFIFPILQ